MSQLESDLIERLSERAAEPRPEFATKLRRQLIQRESALNNNKKRPRRSLMDYKKVSFGLAGFITLMVAVGLVVPGMLEEDSERTAQEQTTTQASSLPNQQVASLDEARKSLSFKPLVPSAKVGDETLTNIRVGTQSAMLDDSDTLYLTYGDASGTIYKTSQSSKKFNYPTDVERVALTVAGRKVTASYYQLADFEPSQGPSSAGEDVSAPRSYIFWSQAGVNYEISEFGRLSKQQLVALAESLKATD